MNLTSRIPGNSQRHRIKVVSVSRLQKVRVQPNKPAAPAEKQSSQLSARIPAAPKRSVIQKLIPATPRLQSATAKTVSVSNESLKHGTQLLTDIKGIFNKNESKIRTQHILDTLADKKPWSTICNGKPIDARRLSLLIKPYGIHSMDLRFADGSAYKGYRKEWFTEASNAKGKSNKTDRNRN